MLRREPAGKARDREVKAPPEEVDGTALAQEARAKALQDALGLRERTPEAVGLLQIVRLVRLVLLEGNRVGNLDGRRPNLHVVESKNMHVKHKLFVKVCDRSWLKVEHDRVAEAGRDAELVGYEVKV